MWSWVGDWTGVETFNTVEQFAHQGLSKEQCTYASLLSLLPYAYWLLWQLHFLLVVKEYWEHGQVDQNQKQVRAWRVATDILNQAGLRNEGISPQRGVVQIQTSLHELVIESIDASRPEPAPEQEVSGRVLLPPIRGPRPCIQNQDIDDSDEILEVP